MSSEGVMEGGIRTPCLVRGPDRIPAGRVTNELVHEIDFLPDRILNEFNATILRYPQVPPNAPDPYSPPRN